MSDAKQPDSRPESLSLPGEEWRSISGFEGIYSISSLGRVYTFDKSWHAGAHGGLYTRPGRILNPGLNKRGNGYYVYTLTRPGLRKTYSAHRLVAFAFVSGDTSLEVNHKDSDTKNNRPENLEWVTHDSNMGHAADHALCLHGEDHRRAQLTNAQVIEIKSLLSSNSVASLARKYGVSYQTIYYINRGESWRKVG